MKKNLLVIGALALLLTGCANNEPDGMQEQVQYEPGNGFMSFNLTTPSSSTRATTTPADDETNGIYEDGSPEENAVSHVRFYFFNDQDQPFGVHKHLTDANSDSFIDWTPNKADFTGPVHNETVEQGLKAAIELNLKKKSDNGEWEYPTKVVAILNPTSEIVALGVSEANDEGVIGPKLADLTGYVADFQNGLTSSNFVMTNSVYALNGKEMIATPIEAENVQSSAEAARANPVTIYVERIVARVDFQISEQFTLYDENGDVYNGNDKIKKLTDGSTIYRVGSYTIYKKDGQGNMVVSETPLYVKFLGWNATQTTSASRLLKMINPSWENEEVLGDLIWNSTKFNRSFWATNPQTTNFEYLYGIFSKSYLDKADESMNALYTYYADGNPIPDAGEDNENSIYIQENANPYANPLVAAAPTDPTNLIVAAQIVDEDGNPYQLAQWMGHKYTEGALLDQIAATLATIQPDGGLFYAEKDSEGNIIKYNPITANDIEYVSADPTNPNSTDPRYYTYVALTSAAEELNWYIGKDKNSMTPLTTADAVNSIIRQKIGHVLVWGTGNSYYATPIRHLGSLESVGYNGIVRNHIYQIAINAVKGLGTPVFDGSEVIIPEEPTETQAMLSADIKILQWRVVAQDYTLTW